jgi:acyl-coenzyme A thioesterase PaaI-like protein
VKVHAYPSDHMWRDLNFSMEYEGEKCCTIRAPVVAGLCNDQGVVQIGFIATLFDLVGGELAARTAYPDWIATADMVMYSKQRARAGELVAVGSVVRAGRSSVVIEADILAKPKQSGALTSIGSAIAAFTRLRSREDTVQTSRDNASHQVFTLEGSGSPQDILGKAGLRVLDEAAGVVELNMSDYVRNAFHGMHGGMFGLLADVAGQSAARAVARRPLITSDLSIHYLSMGKVGPFCTKTRIVRATGDIVVTRVEILDRGKEDLLMAVAINTATMA